MTPQSAEESYRRALATGGRTVQLRRYSGPPALNRNFTDHDVQARVREFRADELAGNIRQGDRQVIILASDLQASGFPGALRANDKLILDGAELNLQTVDAQSRRIEGVLIAYEAVARGL